MARVVLVRYLSAQLEELRRQEPLVRSDAPDSVHRMRVASRRARSALATYSSLLDREATEALRGELRWVGATLGEARDAEVLQARLESRLTDQPATPGLEAVSRRIRTELDGRQAEGRSRTLALLDSERYAAMLEKLAGLAAVAQAADDRGSEVAGFVLRDWKRLRRRARLAADTPAGPARDQALHDVRKAAKRLRYAAESAVPVLGERAVALAASCETLQDLLGEHHDSVVARELLRAVRDEAPAAGSMLVLDALHAHEEAVAAAVERDYEGALDGLVRKRVGRWLRPAS